MIWASILVASAGCYAAKLAGLSVPERILAGPRAQRIAAMLPVVLLAALIAMQTVTAGRHLVLDARLAGMAVAGVAVWRRWPFLAVVGSAIVTTALLRLLLPGS